MINNKLDFVHFYKAISRFKYSLGIFNIFFFLLAYFYIAPTYKKEILVSTIGVQPINYIKVNLTRDIELTLSEYIRTAEGLLTEGNPNKIISGKLKNIIFTETVEKKLWESFTNKVVSNEMIAEALIKLDMMPLEDIEEGVTTIAKTIEKYVSSIKLNYPTKYDPSNPVNSFKISLSDTQLENELKNEVFISYLVERANDSLNKDIIYQIESLLLTPINEYIEVKNQGLIRLQKFAKKQLNLYYDLDLKYLEEQKKLAKALFIKKPIGKYQIDGSIDETRNFAPGGRASNKLSNQLDQSDFTFNFNFTNGYDVLDKVIIQLEKSRSVILEREFARKNQRISQLTTLYDFKYDLDKIYALKLGEIINKNFFDVEPNSVFSYTKFDNNFYLILPYLLLFCSIIISVLLVSLYAFRKII